MDLPVEAICDALQECSEVSRALEETPGDGSSGYADDVTWILTSSFVILTMQTGFGLLEMGSSRSGYEVNILMKNVADVLFGGVAYFLVGYGISFGTPSNPFMGLGGFAPAGGTDSINAGLLYAQYIFQFSFAATSTTIVSGAVAMRMKFEVYCLFSFFVVFGYAVVTHWVWGGDGWLASLGVHDFAGGGPVHLFGAMNALIGATMVGPRTGRFDGSRPKSEFKPVSVTSILFGLFMLWWGWIGFNCGSTFGVTNNLWIVAVRCAITTINSTAAGGITAMSYSLLMSRKKRRLINPVDVANGILGALVAITPACAAVPVWASFVIGALGALTAAWGNALVYRFNIDDPVGAFGVHGTAAIWGLISVGLLTDNTLAGNEGLRNGLFLGGGWYQLGVQLLEAVMVVLWSIAFATPFFYLTGVALSRQFRNPRAGIRVTKEEEDIGADAYLHGIGAYGSDRMPGSVKSSGGMDLDEEDDPGTSVHFSADVKPDKHSSSMPKAGRVFRSFRVQRPPPSSIPQSMMSSTVATSAELSQHSVNSPAVVLQGDENGITDVTADIPEFYEDVGMSPVLADQAMLDHELEA